ncbi:MAG: LysR substrate-binding domain-containing protein [Mycobacteriales bacterium]
MSSVSAPAVTVAQLRAFLAVAVGGSVREAARQLVVTESAVSSAVGALNRQVGIALLERHGRGVRCSAAGLAFAPYARRVLGLLEEGRVAATGGADPEVGTVRIAAVTTAAEQVLPTLLAGFRADHPGVTLRLQVSDNRTLWAAFGAYEADVVLAGRPPASVDGAATRATRANRLIAVAAPAVRVDASRTAWLMREPGSGIRVALEVLLAAQELDPPLLYMGSSGAVTAGAVAGLGLALVSEDAVRSLLADGALRVVELPDLPLVRPWHLVTRDVPTATAQLFVEHLLAAPHGRFSVARSPVPVPTR